MRTNKILFCLLFVVNILCPLAWGGLSVAADMAIDRRPDLIVSKIAIVSEYLDAQNLRLKFTIYVKNQLPSVLSSTAQSVSPMGLRNDSRGTCKTLVEWTNNDKIYNRLCEFTVPVLVGGSEYKYYCGSQVLPKGEFRRWRAKVDHLNWISETNETNNEKSESVIW